MAIKRIVVAFDGSEGAIKALDFAIDDLVCPGTTRPPEIFVLSVVSPPEHGLPVAVAPKEVIIEHAKRYFEDHLKELKDETAKRNIEVKTELAVGHPVEEIVKFIKEKDCDMVIVGQIGKSKVETLLLGSVSRSVATHAPCTVIIVK